MDSKFRNVPIAFIVLNVDTPCHLVTCFVLNALLVVGTITKPTFNLASVISFHDDEMDSFEKQPSKIGCIFLQTKF